MRRAPWKPAVAGAARNNGAARAALALLTGQVEPTTVAAAYWRWTKAHAGEGGGAYGADVLLCKWQVYRVRMLALRLLGREACDAHCKRPYPNDGVSWLAFWRNVLTGERIEFTRERVADRKPGEPALRCTAWYEQRQLSSAA
jgi:hypothetical protein